MTSAVHLRVVEGQNGGEGQAPPHDPDAEAAVLSAVLVDRSAMPRIIDLLRPKHFFYEAHRWIFEASASLYRAGEPVDTQTVASWLQARGRLAQVGGIEALTEIVGASPSFGNVRAHAVAVHEMARRRALIAACQKICAHGYGGLDDVQRWADEAVRTCAAIAAQNPMKPVESNEQALVRIMRDAESEPPESGGVSSQLTGFPTGIYGLDRIIGGLRKGAKTTIAAVTGVGKTSFAAQLAMSAAKQGLGVLFFSTELKREELLRRALAHEAQISGKRIAERRLSPMDKAALASAARRLKALPWRIDERPRPTIEDIARAAKAMAEQFRLIDRVPLGMIVVDYIQRLDPAPDVLHREKHEQVGHATRSFKVLCQELDVIGLELAQAKDHPAGKKPERPRASTGIADSSQIAKESDDVIFLVPEDDPQHDPRQSIKAIVAKQRAGGKGDVALQFRRDIYRFIDPNTPNPAGSNPSRQYVDDNPLTDGL